MTSSRFELPLQNLSNALKLSGRSAMPQPLLAAVWLITSILIGYGVVHLTSICSRITRTIELYARIPFLELVTMFKVSYKHAGFIKCWQWLMLATIIYTICTFLEISVPFLVCSVNIKPSLWHSQRLATSIGTASGHLTLGIRPTIHSFRARRLPLPCCGVV
jgi:hypothetical protein